jgi:hypothetical protein
VRELIRLAERIASNHGFVSTPTSKTFADNDIDQLTHLGRGGSILLVTTFTRYAGGRAPDYWDGLH